MADLIDLTGRKFGRLYVVCKGQGRRTSGGAYKATWLCRCDCGKEIEVDAQKLRKGHTTSCGCLKHENKGPRFENLVGKRFGRLTVIRFIPHEERTTRAYDWWCRCDCGNEVRANANKLKNGLQQSCGCLKEEKKYDIGDVNRKYKHTNKRLYGVYSRMIGRCTDPSDKRWDEYGGRGIRVCPEWLGEYGYDAFAEWAFQSGYNKDAKQGECTLDRTDVNGDYSPENCRWISNLAQQNNRRYHILAEYNGKTYTAAELSRMFNIPYTTMLNAIKSGKSIEKFLVDYAPRGRG